MQIGPHQAQLQVGAPVRRKIEPMLKLFFTAGLVKSEGDSQYGHMSVTSNSARPARGLLLSAIISAACKVKACPLEKCLLSCSLTSASSKSGTMLPPVRVVCPLLKGGG